MNYLAVLRTDMNSGQGHTQGSGLFRAGPDAHAGIYGLEGPCPLPAQSTRSPKHLGTHETSAVATTCMSTALTSSSPSRPSWS